MNDFRYLVLDAIALAPLSGRRIHAMLFARGAGVLRPKFNFNMAGMERDGLVTSSDSYRTIDGIESKERHYRITDAGFVTFQKMQKEQIK